MRNGCKNLTKPQVQKLLGLDLIIRANHSLIYMCKKRFQKTCLYVSAYMSIAR